MTTINIERLSTGTEIVIPSYDAVEVLECTFDGSGYSITVCTNPRYGWDAVDHLYIEAGGSVECAGKPRWTRSDAAITPEEWNAHFTAVNAQITDLIAQQNLRAEFFGAVARSLSVGGDEGHREAAE